MHINYRVWRGKPTLEISEQRRAPGCGTGRCTQQVCVYYTAMVYNARTLHGSYDYYRRRHRGNPTPTKRRRRRRISAKTVAVRRLRGPVLQAAAGDARNIYMLLGIRARRALENITGLTIFPLPLYVSLHYFFHPTTCAARTAPAHLSPPPARRVPTYNTHCRRSRARFLPGVRARVYR